MNTNGTIYEFSQIVFFPLTSTLENKETGKRIKIPQNYSHFLLALIKRFPEVAEYDEIRSQVWVQYPEMSESLKHLIQETKRGFIQLLRNEGFPYRFIEVVPGKGYVIKTPVKLFDQPTQVECENNSLNVATESDMFERDNSTPAHVTYRSVVSLVYGLLFAVSYLIEIAYEFDRFKGNVVFVLLPLVILNSSAMYYALANSFGSSINVRNRSLWKGLVLLIGAAIFTAFSMLQILPWESITTAQFQTQPAFAAFLKSTLLYNLPTGIAGVFIPYYLYTTANVDLLKGVLPSLIGFFLVIFTYSLLTTFYLLDGLLPSRFHGLFVTLIFIRMGLYFGICGFSLIWIGLETNTKTGIFGGRFEIRPLLVFGVLAIAMTTYFTVIRNWNRVTLSKIEWSQLPNNNNELMINIYGENFDPESVCVRVTGLECPESAPCIVPNGALRKHSRIGNEALIDVPLTLPAGRFSIFVQNGNSPFSNGLTFEIPETD
jgi:DNA-binding winged helix-turn-helix (wHTH) protein